MLINAPILGQPSLFSLTATSILSAEYFYGGLFGWKLESAETGLAFTLGGEPVARLREAQSEPVWDFFIAVEDLDEALTLATRNGARTVTIFEDAGADTAPAIRRERLAMIVDPTGAQLGLWQPGSELGARIVREPSTVAWVEEKCRDQAAACDFLQATFGYQFAGPAGRGKVRAFFTADHPFGGVMEFDDRWGDDEPAHWLLYFAVDDLTRTVSRAEQLGGSVWFPEFETPLGRLAYLRDREGVSFAVVAVSEQGRGMIGA